MELKSQNQTCLVWGPDSKLVQLVLAGVPKPLSYPQQKASIPNLREYGQLLYILLGSR